ncbi:MAG: type IV pilus assembly protein PilM [Planctomycetota bacterium]|jgi:type IV pilus assembly protein PilM
MFGGPTKLIGLDIGTNCVKAIEITNTKGALSVTGYGQAEMVSEGSKADAIVQACRGFHTKRVASAVSGKSVIVRFLNMPRTSDDNLMNVIRVEADKYIPFDVEEVVLDAHKMPDDGGDEMRVLLVAVKRSLIDEHVSLLQGVGLSPAFIDVDSFALGNSFELRNRLSPQVEAEEKTVALVDVGANKTNVNIIRGTTSYFIREIYLGGDDLTSSISKRLGIEAHSAENLKREPGENADQLREAVMSSIEDLGNEIHLSLDYFENQFDKSVDEVYLSGGASRLAILGEAFEKIFEKRTVTWDPTENIVIDESGGVDAMKFHENASQMAISLGLASRILKN